MKTARTTALVVLLTLAGSSQALPHTSFIVQDPKPANESDHPKNSIDKMIEEANERGEHIYASCLDNCDEASNKSADGVERPTPIELPKPVYPAIAAAAHVSGNVQVKVIVDTEGNVIAAASISGHPLLQASAVNAARFARFTPAKLNGSPVKVVGVIVYNFVAP